MIKKIRYILLGDCLAGELALADAVEDLQLLICEDEVLLVELVADRAPPVRVFGARDEFFDFVACRCDWWEEGMDGWREMVNLIIIIKVVS